MAHRIQSWISSAWPKTPTFFPPKLAILFMTSSVKFPSGGFFGDFSAIFVASRPSGPEIRSQGNRPPPRRCSGVGTAMIRGGLRVRRRAGTRACGGDRGACAPASARSVQSGAGLPLGWTSRPSARSRRRPAYGPGPGRAVQDC